MPFGDGVHLLVGHGGGVFDGIDMFVQRDLDTFDGVRVRRHLESQCVRFVDGGAYLSDGLVAPAHLVSHGEHAAAEIQFDAGRTLTGPRTHKLAAFIGRIGHGVALTCPRWREQVAVACAHADLAVDQQSGAGNHLFVQSAGHGHFRAMGRHVAHRRHAVAHARQRIAQHMQRAFLRRRVQRPCRGVRDPAVACRIPQVQMGVDQAGNHAQSVHAWGVCSDRSIGVGTGG